MIKRTKDKSEGMYDAIPLAPPTLDIPGVAIMRRYAKSAGVDLDAQGTHYVQGWWSMPIMVEGIQRTLDTQKDLAGPNTKDAMESMKGYDTGGVTRLITFTPTDHRGNQALRVYQVKDGKWQAITDYISVPAAK